MADFLACEGPTFGEFVVDKNECWILNLESWILNLESCEGPTFGEFVVDKNEHVYPMVAAGASLDEMVTLTSEAPSLWSTLTLKHPDSDSHPWRWRSLLLKLWFHPPIEGSRLSMLLESWISNLESRVLNLKSWILNLESKARVCRCSLILMQSILNSHYRLSDIVFRPLIR